jgi:hypothetical protein
VILAAGAKRLADLSLFRENPEGARLQLYTLIFICPGHSLDQTAGPKISLHSGHSAVHIGLEPNLAGSRWVTAG